MRHMARRPGLYYGWVVVAVTFWMALITTAGRSGFGVFVIPISTAFGWSRGSISLAAALATFVSGFTGHHIGGALSAQLGGVLRDVTASYTLPCAIAPVLLVGASLVSFGIQAQRYSSHYQGPEGSVPAALNGLACGQTRLPEEQGPC